MCRASADNAKTRGVTVQVVEDGSDEFDEDASPRDLRNDELFVRVESQDFYTPYYNHFNDAYNTGAAL